MIPDRVAHLEEARHRWGSAAERVARLYAQADPLADEALASVPSPGVGWRLLEQRLAGRTVDAPPALARLVQTCRAPLPWQDADRCERGAAVLRRWAPWVALVLRCYALPQAYRSPAGNKPLVRSKRLTDDAGRRLYETAWFVWRTQQPGGMAPAGAGTAACARVRWIHALTRARLRADGWDDASGAPLPQPDLAATGLLFGPVTVHGLRRLGATIDDEEADAVAHLYRVVAARVGVCADLQTDTWAGGMDRFALLTFLHEGPDDDSVVLTEALMDVPVQLARGRAERLWGRVLRRAFRGVSGGLLGPRAEGLGLPEGRPWLVGTRALLRLTPSPLPLQDALVRRVLARQEGTHQLRG